MKRQRILLTLIACIVGGGYNLSAQEVNVGKGTLRFEGKIAGGVFFESDNTIQQNRTGALINQNYIGPDGRVFLWNESDNESPLRADLTAIYSQENIGFRIRLQANSALQGFDQTEIARYAYGWVSLFNDGLKFTGGLIDLSDNVWGTLGDGDWDIGGNGLRLELKPLKFFKIDEDPFFTEKNGGIITFPVGLSPWGLLKGYHEKRS
jgi:hypothetical protein